MDRRKFLQATATGIAGSALLPGFMGGIAMAGEGESVRIVLIRGGQNIQKRMLSMGLTLDDVIEIVQRQNKGAVLISKAGSRYAFGGGMAHKINVTKV